MTYHLKRQWLAVPSLVWAGICFYLTLSVLQRTHSTETLIVVSLIGTAYGVSLLLAWISFGRWASIVMAVVGMGMMGLPVVSIPYGWFLGYFIWFGAVLFLLDWADKCYENERLVEQVKTERNLEEKNRLIQELIRRRASTQVLREKYRANVNLKAVADEFASTLSLTELADLVVRKTSEVLSKTELVLLYSVDLDTSLLSLTASYGSKESKKFRAKHGDLFDRWVLKYRQPLLVSDVAGDFRFDTSREDLEPELKCIMAAPMVSEGRLTGALRVNSSQMGVFNTDDLRVLSILAVLASSALTNAVLYQKTEELAIHDSLTGLYVQRYFRERFEEEHKRALMSNAPFSVLMCDIDYFKKFNDQYGHAAGDLVLKAVANSLREGVGDSGIVARYGGEEFAVVLRNMNKTEACELAESLRKHIELLRVSMRAIELKVTLSIGIASFPQDSLDREALITAADQALYQAKRQGRNIVCSGV